MNRRSILTAGVAALVAAAAPWMPTESVTRAQSQGKKGKKKGQGKAGNKKSDGNPDGKDTVDGAIWLFSATNVRTGEKVEFYYRVSDRVLYDRESNIVIGKTEHTKKKTARL